MGAVLAVHYIGNIPGLHLQMPVANTITPIWNNQNCLQTLLNHSELEPLSQRNTHLLKIFSYFFKHF